VGETVQEEGEGGRMRKTATIKRKTTQICRKYSSQSYKYL
jgi:hypothetical protein